MAYEVDYIPVGDGERSGDAIALRFGNLAGRREEQAVIVIDGGFKDSGEALVQHIKTHYKTDRVDLVVSTHPDADHASGLSVVVENLTVGTLLMHKPWEHASEIKNLFKNGKITASGLEARLEASLQHASDLEALANKKGVRIVEPFQGASGYNGVLRVLGPSVDYYEKLLPHFRSTPQPIPALAFLAPVARAAGEAVRWIRDFVHIDLIDDDEDSTSAENNTSVILLFSIDGHKLLFTGDAGKTALHLAADYADSLGVVLIDLQLFDVPHHGSKRNLSSKVLKRICGSKASISAPKDSPKHPAEKVVNALKKHGAAVYVTKGRTICYPHNSQRPGWGPVEQEPFHEHVEE